MVKKILAQGVATAVFSFVGVVSGFGMSFAAANPVPQTIMVAARTIVHRPPSPNVYPLTQQDIPNGEYRVSIEVANAKLYTGNTILVLSASNRQKTTPTSTQQLTFSDVGIEALYRMTAPKTLTVDQGKVLVSVAVGSQLSGDKTFDGSVKITLTPVTPQVQAATLARATAQTAQTAVPRTLPETGSGHIPVIFIGASGLGYMLHRRRVSHASVGKARANI